MLRVTIECKNARSEKIARYLGNFTDDFKVWTHQDIVYALFDIQSLLALRDLRKRLKRIKNLEFRFIKIRTLENHEA